MNEQTNNKDSQSLHNEHKVTVAALKNYKLLVDSVEDYAIFLLDPEGYIVSWNKGARRNKGYEASEIIGKHFSQFYLQDDIDAKKPEKELEIAKKLGRIEDEDWRVRKDGSRFWANVIITALFDEDGGLVGFAKVTRDLTERKQHEDDLRKANVLLRSQREELKRLNAAKDEFISLASHQLRTPATAVKQLLGMILEGFYGDVPADILQAVQKAEESNERQIQIVNSLLKVAQLDAGKVVLKLAPVNIGTLLSSVISEQMDTISGRQQTIIFDQPPVPISVDVDEKYFRMALENFIDNASKYTHEKGSITLSATTDNKSLQIKIKDTGVGIAGEDLETLFTKFNRIPNDLSQKTPGSGLGLYWAKEIINLHGGNIEVTSEVSKGTEFTITLLLGTHHA